MSNPAIRFIRKFSEKKGIFKNIIKIENRFYSINDKHKRYINDNTIYAGNYLGKETRNDFIPSIRLLQLLETDKKTIVNDKGAYLFTCKRDILKESVISSKTTDDGLTIIADEDDNVLGMAKKEGNVFKNKIDIGIFLRD